MLLLAVTTTLFLSVVRSDLKQGVSVCGCGLQMDAYGQGEVERNLVRGGGGKGRWGEEGMKDPDKRRRHGVGG